MNTKHTIIVSAATCLVVNLLFWMLGWLVWPLVWAISGIAILKFAYFLEGNCQAKDPVYVKVLAALMGPIMIIPFILAAKEGEFDFRKLNLPKFPKIRNPFVWTKDDN